MDVGLNKCLFNLVGLKDNVRRNAYQMLPWNVPGSLIEALGLDCHRFASVLFRLPGRKVEAKKRRGERTRRMGRTNGKNTGLLPRNLQGRICIQRRKTL